MTTLRIDAPEGVVKLGEVTIPGVYQSLEITGAVKLDEVSRSGRSGKSKLPVGWEDMGARLGLRLLTEQDETYPSAALATIAELFQKADSAAKPVVYTIVHPACAAVRLREVLFSTLRIADDNQDDTVDVELEFTEFKPVALGREGRARKALKGSLAAAGELFKDLNSELGFAAKSAASAGYDAVSAIDKVNEKAKVYSTSPNGLADMFENDPEGGGPLGIF